MCGAIRHVRAVMLISIINFLPRGLCDQGVTGQPGKVLKVTTQHSNLRLNPQVGGPAVISLPAARQGRDASRDQAGRNWNDGKAARGSSRKVERGPASKAGTLQDLLLRTAERKPAPRDSTAAPAAYKAVKAADVLRRTAGPVSLKARHGSASAADSTMTVIRASAVPFGASERPEAEVRLMCLSSIQTAVRRAACLVPALLQEEAGGDAFNMLLSWFGGAEASSGEMDEKVMLASCLAVCDNANRCIVAAAEELHMRRRLHCEEEEHRRTSWVQSLPLGTPNIVSTIPCDLHARGDVPSQMTATRAWPQPQRSFCGTRRVPG